jgi:CheY-like chemotaxis protein
MAKNRMMMLGPKESFIIRVLSKKVQDAGFECGYLPLRVDEINEKLKGEEPLIALYIDEEDKPHQDVLHFLIDVMEEKDIQLILIGESEDLKTIGAQIPVGLVYRSFERPVDNAGFVKAVSDYFKKLEKGESKKRLLIVDDDPQYLATVREWLKEDYNVTMANSGLQAIRWLGRNKVDLILLDHEMPVTSGPQVLEMLRSEEDTRNIPVMFLTGKGDKESVMAVVALRPEGYFLKNIKKDELLDKLQEYFILHK